MRWVAIVSDSNINSNTRTKDKECNMEDNCRIDFIIICSCGIEREKEIKKDREALVTSWTERDLVYLVNLNEEERDREKKFKIWSTLRPTYIR